MYGNRYRDIGVSRVVYEALICQESHVGKQGYCTLLSSRDMQLHNKAYVSSSSLVHGTDSSGCLALRERLDHEERAEFGSPGLREREAVPHINTSHLRSL